MDIFCTYMEQPLEQQALLQRIAFLPSKIQAALLAYRRAEDATASFLGKCLIAKAFHHLQIPFDWKDVHFTSKDRPFLKDAAFDFNISHSGKWIVAVVAKSQVGIDVEKHRKINLDVFNRQFSDDEWQIIRSAPEPEQQFFEYWTIKEAAIKADGRGVEVLSSTNIQNQEIVKVVDKEWNYRPFKIASGYSSAIVSSEPFGNSFNIKEIKMKDVLHLS